MYVYIYVCNYITTLKIGFITVITKTNDTGILSMLGKHCHTKLHCHPYVVIFTRSTAGLHSLKLMHLFSTHGKMEDPYHLRLPLQF